MQLFNITATNAALETSYFFKENNTIEDGN